MYQAPWWLPGGHAQTIWPAKIAPLPALPLRRERWETPDGDFIDVDHLDSTDAGAPLLVLFHGLEGDSTSHYCRALARAARTRGWQFAIPHFRGCSGEINRLPRAYHSGDSAEIDWVLRRFHTLAPDRPLYAVGVSLGGNALLKWLGEQGEAAGFVQAAAAVSAPLDLEAGARALSRGFNLVYTRNFLGTLKRKSLLKLEQFPGLFDRRRMLASRDFFDFDDAVTAPLHGFDGCYDYWQRSSSKPFLRHIRRPLLLVHARNDPFLPPQVLPRPDELSDTIETCFVPEGGHVGFPQPRWPGAHGWLPDRLVSFLARVGPAAPYPSPETLHG